MNKEQWPIWQPDEIINRTKILHTAEPYGEDTMSKRFDDLFKVLGLDKKYLHYDRYGQILFRGEVASFIVLLVRDMDSVYMAEMRRHGNPRGSIELRKEKVEEFRERMGKRLAVMKDSGQMQLCQDIVDRLAHPRMYSAADLVRQQLETILIVLNNRDVDIVTDSWIRLSNLLERFIGELKEEQSMERP